MPKLDPRTPLMRPDGRPEAYVINVPATAEGVPCWNCVLENNSTRYRHNEIFLCSPIDSADGAAHPICLKHLPANIVIYDPETKLCRDRDGQAVWHEGTKQ
jgi:hypothetical protein